jgi:hypothetical protein
MITKITISEARKILLNPAASRTEIEKYLIADPLHSRPFSPSFTFNPETVDLAAMNVNEETQGQLAFDFANKIERTNRERMFKKAIDKDKTRPVLYAEGDSWFQFPFLIEDLIDNLGNEYLIFDTSRAGDTLKNMLDIDNAEYLDTLTKLIHLDELNVCGFLFSGAGNDVIGADESNESYLKSMVKDYDSTKSLDWHLDTAATLERLSFIESSYRSLLQSIESRFPLKAFPQLKVYIHGYDYVQVKSLQERNSSRPYPPNWTGDPLRVHKFPDNATGSALLRILIDKLNAITKKVCDENPRGVYIDLRGTVLPTQWEDELHPTSQGFKSASKQFSAALKASGLQST